MEPVLGTADRTAEVYLERQAAEVESRPGA
jgi:hypothetical protein